YYYEYESYELFNLRNDISEQHDLSESQPDIANALLTELRQWVKEVDAPVPSEPNPSFNP
ncbi:MAG: sulfatase, partial [Planctomycetota bacterium]